VKSPQDADGDAEIAAQEITAAYRDEERAEDRAAGVEIHQPEYHEQPGEDEVHDHVLFVPEHMEVHVAATLTFRQVTTDLYIF